MLQGKLPTSSFDLCCCTPPCLVLSQAQQAAEYVTLSRAGGLTAVQLQQHTVDGLEILIFPWIGISISNLGFPLIYNFVS